jgi:hypothetical protein
MQSTEDLFTYGGYADQQSSVKWAFDIPSVYLMKKFHSCAPEQLSTS